ncbi:MAG: hypothetical protein AAGA54_37065, partial [Myxococcota bacterium]
ARPPVPSAPGRHAPSRTTANRGGFTPGAQAPAPAALRPPAMRAPAPAPSAGGGYAPPAPDYEDEEIKTAIAAEAYDPAQEEAKTRVSGTTADDVRAFLAAAPPAQLGAESQPSLVEKTQVAPTTAADVAAFIAAAPPANLASESPSPMVMKTQVAPASAAEIRALAEAGALAQGKNPQDLFSTPSAPTRPGTAPKGGTQEVAIQPRGASPSMTVPSPGAAAPKPGLPAPSDLPPPGGITQPMQQMQEPARRDTIMNAPAQPVALGGANRPAPAPAPGAAPRSGMPAPASPALEEQATTRMATHDVPPAAMTARQGSAAPPPQHAPAGAPSLQPVQPAQQAWGMNQGNTMPMPISDVDDEPLVVPGRNGKIIAMVITIVVGILVGGLGVWFFVLRN